ncbi:putative RNA-dependent RNA polymerase 1 [Glarea lozoyensis 74030]|uniref:RNA-dependent RNA polymerase n=1 Tax=Glarea lozoyensis (strain ATCC 74030 / MF5533) TaxID=1104152 RepID=H0EYH6_GLAL7|nr:putative RNA-dependent RNA polymerase 1 [Glarea lozoyensis 74030]
MAPEVALPVPQTPSRKKTSGEVNAIKLLVEMLVMDLENKWGSQAASRRTIFRRGPSTQENQNPWPETRASPREPLDRNASANGKSKTKLTRVSELEKRNYKYERPNIPASEAHFKAPNNTAPSSDYDAGSVFEGSSFEEVFKQSTDVNGLLRGVALDPGRVDDSLSQELLNVGIENKRNMLTVEDVLQNRLDAVFPQLPPSLDVDSVKLYVIYEITRVFVYVGASMASVNFPQTADFDDYDKLWNFLQNLPELKGKNFPPKSERAAWEAAKTDFTSRGTGLELGVVFSGSLTYEMSEGTNPLFQFQLKPLTLDKKHRLSRRLGEDRFIQIDMPHLHGDFLPKSLQSDSGHAALLKWLVERRHWLFGRTWRPFHSKQKDRKDKKEKKNHKVSDPAHCVYFFAVDGRGLYNTGSSISLNNERPQERHTAIEVDALLNMVRLTRKNKHQPYLKLFSRTSLEPDEVYMDFSSFVDDVSGQSGVLLHRQDVLVARSPAHFVSDIQKVKAVAKVELIGLKDVIVFSTKGNPSLAAKLSGGDYDGDLAWLCWEPSIVNNFVDAEVPDVPDFVQQGFVRQDKTTYEELVKNQEHPVSHFLKCSLSFNMKQSMLGICTAWKETYCYNQGTVASKEATTLSALLSLLVDQAKQGYSFDAEDWNRLRKSLTEGKNVTTFIPEYKKLKPEFKKDAKHIIDFLMYEAHLKVDNSLTAFQAAIPQNIPQWDADLSSLYNWAAEAAKVTNEWDGILKDLTKDLEALKLSWSKEFTKGKASENPDDAVDFKATLFEHFEMYQRIQPKTITTLTHLLLCDYASPEYTHWSLLKASTLFSSFHKSNVKPVVWFMAGRQLVHLKSLKVSPSGPHAIVPHMYVCYKPNSSFIRQRQRRDVEYIENVGVRSVDEVDATQED